MKEILAKFSKFLKNLGHFVVCLFKLAFRLCGKDDNNDSGNKEE